MSIDISKGQELINIWTQSPQRERTAWYNLSCTFNLANPTDNKFYLMGFIVAPNEPDIDKQWEYMLIDYHRSEPVREVLDAYGDYLERLVGRDPATGYYGVKNGQD